MRKVKWEEMSPDELLWAPAECPIRYMAYGLAELHGAYNALGLDWLKAYSLCAETARTHGSVVAPPMCWHVQERPQFDWPRQKGVRPAPQCFHFTDTSMIRPPVGALIREKVTGCWLQVTGARTVFTLYGTRPTVVGVRQQSGSDGSRARHGV